MSGRAVDGLVLFADSLGPWWDDENSRLAGLAVQYGTSADSRGQGAHVDDAPYTGDLDLGAVDTRDDLAVLLRTVHVRADKPSLRTLEARTRHTPSPLSKTAVAEMLRGVRFPRKAVMVAFLRACGVQDDDMELWRRAWDRVADGEKGLARSGAVRTAPSTGNAFLAEQRTSAAGGAGEEEWAEGARDDRMTAAAGVPADPAGIVKIQYQTGEHPSGLSAVSPAELQAFGAELTKTLGLRRKTLEQAATKLAVPPAEIARWAGGQGLPSEPQARLLDDYLRARGAIRNLVAELRSRPDNPGRRLVPVSLPSSSAPTLLQVFQNVAGALRACLARDAGGRPVGWPYDLRELSGEATALSTAYGIRTMLLLEDGLAADLVPVADSLRRMADPAGGFAGRGQSGPRPEATAVVLSALRRIAVTEDFDAHIAQLESGLGDFEKYRPFILTTMLEACLLLRPGIRLVEALVGSLLEARRPYGDLLLWPEKAEPLLIDPAPSVAHTALAVRALASVQAIRPNSQVQEALGQAAAWLIEQHDLHNAYEVTERSADDRPELVYVRHFTAAWVVKALVSAGVPTAHPAVSNAEAQIWKSYGGDTTALWAWENGDLPIWMTFDAIEALRLTHLAAAARTSWSPSL
jgi:hypothetical protein